MIRSFGIMRPVFILAFTICVLAGVKTLAAAECAPAWESFAEESMYDRAAAEGVLPVNAFCSAEHLTRAGQMRGEFRVYLTNALASGSAAARVWAQLFEIAAARSVAGISIQDENLTVSGKLLPLRNTAEEADFGAKKQYRIGEQSGGIIMPSGSKHNFSVIRRTMRCADDAYQSRCNPVEYPLSGAKYDAFRLYLYIESVTDAESECHKNAFCVLLHTGRIAPSARNSSSYHISYRKTILPPLSNRVDASLCRSSAVSKKSITDSITRSGGFA